nr:MAG TPA: Putative helicase [Caudoviricetes sp.]
MATTCIEMSVEETNIEHFKNLMAPCIPSVITPEIINDLQGMGFFTAPAAIHHHGAYTGGLFRHSMAVTNQLLVYTEQLELDWDRMESPYIVGMFHDLCKTDDYIFTKDGWDYRPHKILNGHGEKSVIMAQHLLKSNLTYQEIMCIRWHMGAFDQKENWNVYGEAVACDQNVLYTHTADMYASRVLNI